MRSACFAKGASVVLRTTLEMGRVESDPRLEAGEYWYRQITCIDDPAEGYSILSSPSLVRCVNDQLYFGTEALRRNDGRLFRSLKVNLISDSPTSPGSYGAGLDTRTLVATYMTWAFQRLRQILPQYSATRIFINVAAPMNHYENAELKSKYLQIVHAAWTLSFADSSYPIQQGLSISAAKQILTPLLGKPVPGPETRTFDVLPETIAPIVSLSLDPWMSPGMYMIIDAGAGSTEMSVFHVGGSGADQGVLCYRDETLLLGGNDLQLADQRDDSERWAELERITARLEKQYRRIWQLGYSLDAKNHLSRQRWRELTLVLSGGGTRHTSLSERLADANPIQPWPEKETQIEVCRHCPGTLDISSDLSDDDVSLFAVANGLAIERMHWPVIFQPGEIDALEPTAEVDEKPLGYWYLDAK